MRILSVISISVRNKTLPVIAAVLLYVMPNLVQDVHRVFGHYGHTFPYQLTEGKNIHSTLEKCPVCVFEFYSIEDTLPSVYTILLATSHSFFKADETHQLTSKVFDYSQLRAPPVS